MALRVPVAVTRSLLRGWPLPALRADADKEARGRVLLVAGCRQMPGAALLAAEAVLRAGAGKVTIATAASVAPAIAIAIPEARVLAFAERASGAIASRGIATLAASQPDVDCVLVGPGMVPTGTMRSLVAAMSRRHPHAPTILDAAALDVLMDQRGLAQRGAARIVTPHSGEMARLAGVDRALIDAEPQQWARALARDRQLVVVLKGSTSIIAEPSGQTWIHRARDVGLAISGSGDVLAGVIAGLVARGAAPAQACVWGVALHALAGGVLARRLGTPGLLAREIAGEIPALLRRLNEGLRLPATRATGGPPNRSPRRS